MKRIYFFLFLAFLGTQIIAENLNISGSVNDLNGNPVPGHEVFLNSADSLGGFFYSAVFITNEAGTFSDVIELDANITQGSIIASTESCNDFITTTQFFNPGNYNLNFAFEICVDTTGGGGNDTIIQGCENSFYTYQSGFDVDFFGEVYQDGDVTFSWSFGDGTTGDGMEVSHTYADFGSYTVSLETVLNDTCNFISYQTIYLVDTTGGNDTIYDCQNDFNYTIDGMLVSVYGWGVDSVEVLNYFWSFGDGTSAEGQSATHEYASAGDYIITLTTIAEDNCTAVTSKLVQVNENTGNAFLYGNITVGNSFLDFGIASLYKIITDTISGGDDIVLFSQTPVDSAGSYYFGQVPEGNYLILAQADAASMYYENSLPTYYGNVIYWLDATIIILGEPANPYNINLQTGAGVNQGEGTINGDLMGGDFKHQLINGPVSLFLLDENNNPLEITYSEVNESFDFSNIAFGNYMVYAEVIGLTTELAMITLNAENPTAIIGIYISPNGVTTGIGETFADIHISSKLYPNPVESQAHLDLELFESTQVELMILNQIGQIMESRGEYMTQGMSNIELNTQSYPSGVYFLQIKTAKSTFNQKFIKK